MPLGLQRPSPASAGAGAANPRLGAQPHAAGIPAVLGSAPCPSFQGVPTEKEGDDAPLCRLPCLTIPQHPAPKSLAASPRKRTERCLPRKPCAHTKVREHHPQGRQLLPGWPQSHRLHTDALHLLSQGLQAGPPPAPSLSVLICNTAVERISTSQGSGGKKELVAHHREEDKAPLSPAPCVQSRVLLPSRRAMAKSADPSSPSQVHPCPRPGLVTPTPSRHLCWWEAKRPPPTHACRRLPSGSGGRLAAGFQVSVEIKRHVKSLSHFTEQEARGQERSAIQLLASSWHTGGRQTKDSAI